MVQSPSWEANWFAASQEIPRISRNLKVHYRTHKRPPPVPILGQPNAIHIPTSHLLEIHSVIIHPSTPYLYLREIGCVDMDRIYLYKKGTPVTAVMKTILGTLRFRKTASVV